MNGRIHRVQTHDCVHAHAHGRGRVHFHGRATADQSQALLHNKLSQIIGRY